MSVLSPRVQQRCWRRRLLVVGDGGASPALISQRYALEKNSRVGPHVGRCPAPVMLYIAASTPKAQAQLCRAHRGPLSPNGGCLTTKLLRLNEKRAHRNPFYCVVCFGIMMGFGSESAAVAMQRSRTADHRQQGRALKWII
jgi:hypothetical protein